MAISILSVIEENHSKVLVVFSGGRGFHIHVLDFSSRDWADYNEKSPVKGHQVASLKYTKYHLIIATASALTTSSSQWNPWELFQFPIR